ncbi:MAG: ubiquinol-cytochrome c reductase iron-sulfur subunit [Syntrophobacteraceae bacterium]
MNLENKHSEPAIRRRTLFKAFGWTLLGLASAGLSWIAGRFLSGNQNQLSSEPSRFGLARDFQVGAFVKKGRVMLFRDQAGFWAVTTTCPHLGCQPVFLDQQHIFVCPCHGSRFDAEGRLLNGPATEDMSLAALRLDDQGVIVAYPKEKVRRGFRLAI